MKNLIKIFSLIIFAISIQACDKDNYDPPKSKLIGKITYNGELIGLKGTAESVQLQLYQDGWQLRQPIPVYANQDGTFEALLFDGMYKLITRNNNGPWINTKDTVLVEVRGTTQCEMKVTPYFTISNPQISMNGNIVTAKLTVNKIAENAKIGSVMVMLGNTQFVDGTINIAIKEVKNGTEGDYEIEFDLSKEKQAVQDKVNAARFIYARIGVKATAADQAIYSTIVQLK